MAGESLIANRINRVTFFVAIPISLLIAFILIRIAPVYALIATIGLGIVIATLINTDFAIYTLILSMLLSPEIGTRTTMGEGITIRVDDLLCVIIIFTWLAKTALHKNLGLFKKTFLNKPIAYYVFVCFFSTGIGMIFGSVKFATGSLFVLKYIQYFLIYFMVSNHIRTKKQIENFLIVIIITYLIVSIIAMAQIPAGERLTAPFEGESSEPNTFGGYLILIISINISLFLSPGIFKKRSLRRILFGITLLSFLPFLLTNSRGSWLAAIPVVICYIIISNRRYYILIPLIFLIVAGPFILPDTVIERIKYTFQEKKGNTSAQQVELPAGIVLDASTSERILSWRDALKDVKKHPLLGFGVTGWRFIDSQYMRVLIETGLIGLAAFLYLLYSILKKTWNIYKNAKIPLFKALALGFFIATISMMTHSIGANTFIIVRIMEPFWLLCGLVMAIPQIEEIEQKKLEELEEKGKTARLGFV